MADSEKAKLYQRVTQAPDWWVLERMRLHGFWPDGEGLPPDPPEEAAERQVIEKEIQDLRKKNAINHDPEQALKLERLRRIEDSRERRERARAERAEKDRVRREEWDEQRRATITHVGNGVSEGLQRNESDRVRLEKQGLPLLHRGEDLAAAMGIELSRLRWLTYHRKGATVVHYHRYGIPKKTGGIRNISAPRLALATAQRWVFDHILEKLEPSSSSHGFVRGRNVLSNALPHVGRHVVVNLDVKDFFPSITFRRVKGLFCQVGYSEHIAILLALLCTEPPRVAVESGGKVYHVALSERVLPQGACTSPAITNTICRRLDARLSAFAKRYDFAFTRYADDLTFSGNDSSSVGRVLRMARLVLAEEGFTEHTAKTHVMRKGRRQEVTGVTVNERATVGRKEYRQLRAILHNAARHGLASQNRNDHPAFGEYLRGRVAFIQMIDPQKAEKLRGDLEKALAQG